MDKSNAWKSEIRNCFLCKVEYKPKTPWQETCSYKCGYTFRNNNNKRVFVNHKKCLRCNKSLEHKRKDAIYCSKTCKCMDHNFKHRANESKRVTVARRMDIIRRDNSACYLCKQVIPIELIEIDHLLPVSRLGVSAAHNLSVSCRSCNRSRGNKLGIEQLVRLFELRP